MDLSKVPFAKWLEAILPEVCRQDAKAIAILTLNRDESIGTAFYNACAGDKGRLAWQLLLDGVWDMITVNADRLKEELDELPEDGEDEEQEQEEPEENADAE